MQLMNTTYFHHSLIRGKSNLLIVLGRLKLDKANSNLLFDIQVKDTYGISNRRLILDKYTDLLNFNIKASIVQNFGTDESLSNCENLEKIDNIKLGISEYKCFHKCLYIKINVDAIDTNFQGKWVQREKLHILKKIDTDVIHLPNKTVEYQMKITCFDIIDGKNNKRMCQPITFVLKSTSIDKLLVAAQSIMVSSYLVDDIIHIQTSSLYEPTI